VVLAVALLPVRGQTPRGKRYALLVGVNRYAHPKLATLKYAENDAVALGKVLSKAGYEVVLLTGSAGARRLAATKANIEARLKEVLGKCRRGDTALVALAGHGLQFAGKKDAFFCPVDALPFARRTDRLVSLQKVYEELDDSYASVKLLLIDACRDDPRGGRGSRGIAGDTAPRPPSGVAALFSCRSGQRAFEDDGLRHGVFFHYVLRGLRGAASDSDNEVTFLSLANYVQRQVSRDVPKRLGARQEPSLNARELAGAAVLLRPAEEFTNEVGVKLRRIPGVKPSGRAFYVGVYTVTVGQFRRFAQEGYKTEAERDGQGGWGYSAATRKHEGRLPKYTWKQVGWRQSADHPVVNVSWNDAVAYCKWLNEKAREPGWEYRLATAAEWDHACRAGTTTRYHFGDDLAAIKDYANTADQSLKKLNPVASRKFTFASWDDGHPFTAPVGSYRPNPWGLYDMHGNFWQWCQDKHKDLHPLRGGSWWDHAIWAVPPNGAILGPGDRYDRVGFRVVLAPVAGTP
jgi:formylglycine-generating enzyme required for sulfatase activity